MTAPAPMPPARVALSIGRLAWLLGALAMFGPFSIDTIFPAFGHIGADFGVDKLAMQQSISVYLLAFAAMSLVHGPLSDAIGRRKVILVGLLVFIAASVGCAMAQDLPTLLMFRALQGLSAGVGQIVGRAVIRDVLDGDDAQRLMSQVSMIFSVAPAIAPIIGGWILGWHDWRWIFWFLVAFSSLLWLATWRWLPETHLPAARLPLDARSMLRDYVVIFRNARFQRLAAAGGIMFSALFLYIASAPAFVMDILKLDERQFGWFFVPMISGLMIGAFVSGRAAGRVAGTRLVNLGFACTGIAALGNIGYALLVATPSVPWAVLPLTVGAFGIALIFPILTLAVLDMYPRHRGSASSLQSFTSLVFNAVIAGLVSPWLSGNILHLAIGGAVLSLVGWLFWVWESRVSRRTLACPEAPLALEPMERL